MKNNLYRLHKEINVLDVIEKHEEHLEKNELVVQLDDGYCKIHLDPGTRKYQILVDQFDETVSSSIDDFLYEN